MVKIDHFRLLYVEKSGVFAGTVHMKSAGWLALGPAPERSLGIAGHAELDAQRLAVTQFARPNRLNARNQAERRDQAICVRR
jgi:hypothetical protein